MVLPFIFSKILKKDDGRINWSRPALEIERSIRALNPWPGTWTIWPSGTKIFRVRIETAEITDDEPSEGSYGYVWSSGKHPLLVKTGTGSLVIKSLTIEGKNELTAEQVARGYPDLVGASFV